ncbi:uncharacterized protein LOC125226350 [Leguminivora glycinivorella]|uniref:uncharacterized protein LOC125226350 n=1 Tax=Leguminivora glycinivorella TaxID=1035111 RepID=UPI00200D2F86|nr:uncharacterized protein LOC125226350 [Leguminivora glycinivorella]
MKQSSIKLASRGNGYQSDDDTVRYKLNREFFNNTNKATVKPIKKQENVEPDDDIRYMFPKVLVKNLANDKKPKQKIKVNFWSTKPSISRMRKLEAKKESSNRRHTVAVPSHERLNDKPKNSAVKVRKRVSFLPSPLFSDNHVPMVTVPDDLTIHLNEEEANDLGEDLNQVITEQDIITKSKSRDSSHRKSRSLPTQTSPKGTKRKHSDDSHGNENDLEFFSKYVVQKLRKMETNQRIYSENLINTVLMLGQLSKLNGKYKILEQ